MRIETFNPNKDYGTPARVSETLVTVEIDGVEITVPEGTSVMRAASLANINIPKLCATDNLESFGSCRLCAVQIEGRRGYPASCTTTVDEGMKVTKAGQEHRPDHAKQQVSQITQKCDGAVYFRPSSGLFDLPCQR